MFASRGRNSGDNTLRQTRRQPGDNFGDNSDGEKQRQRKTAAAKNSGGSSSEGAAALSMPNPDPGIGTGHEGKTVRQTRLRTTRTVDCVAWRMKTCGPQA